MAISRSGIFFYRDTLTPGIQGFDEVVDDRLNQLVEFFAPDVEAYMRTNAPWQDQTGNARNTLRAQARNNGNLKGIDIFHGMPYGIWLETRWEGRYSIFEPTLQTKGPELLELAKRVMQA